MTPIELLAQFDTVLGQAEQKATSFNAQQIQSTVDELLRLEEQLISCPLSRPMLLALHERVSRYRDIVVFLNALLEKALRSAAKQNSSGCYADDGVMPEGANRALYERYG
jgi:hypothetical protein